MYLYADTSSISHHVFYTCNRLYCVRHVGRISHTDYHPKEGPPISASAIAYKEGKTFLPTFKKVDSEFLCAMNLEDIACAIADYSGGAANALVAGFDGIEVHAANGYDYLIRIHNAIISLCFYSTFSFSHYLCCPIIVVYILYYSCCRLISFWKMVPINVRTDMVDP